MQRAKVIYNLKIAYCILTMSGIQLIVGCTYPFLSNLLIELRKPTSTIRLNTDEESWLTSIPALVCPFSVIILGILIDKIGRRKTLQLSLIPMVISWILIIYSESYASILVSRLILGVSFGSLTCEFVYIAEVCPANLRPIYSSTISLFVGLGMLIECVVSLYYDWLTIASVMCAASVILFVGLCAVPESPMWLRSRGRAKEARDADRWFHSERPDAATATAPAADDGAPTRDNRSNHRVPAAVAVDTLLQPAPRYWSLFVDRTVLVPTLIVFVYFVCQQGSGVYVLIFYSMDVLRNRNDDSSMSPAVVAIYLAVARVMGGLCFVTLHQVRRRTLSIFSSVGMTVSLIAVIVYGKTFADVQNPPFTFTPIASFVSYMFFSLLGCLPLPWILVGEVFPMRVRGVMNGVMQSCGYILLFVAVKLYPSLVLNYGMENVWTIFAVFCILNILFSIFIMPETKGKSLEEVLSYFESPKKNIKNNITP